MKPIFCTLLFIAGLTACRQEPTMHDDYTRLHPNPPAFSPERTEYRCTEWSPPTAPDAESQRWYKAATLLHAKEWRRTPEEIQNMVILYEAAATRGHYRAINNLYLLYTNVQGSTGSFYDPLQLRARRLLHYGLEQNWAMAYYWLSDALAEGNAGYPHNEKLSLAYLQKAVDLGVPLAQYELGRIYGNRFDKVSIEKLLLGCASQQRFSAAMNELSSYKAINGQLAESLELMHGAVMQGGLGGKSSALRLEVVYAGSKQFMEEFAATPPDPAREAAYRELKVAIDGTSTESGNIFYTFPRLNEVLPLPPGKVKWQGIYSAMSEEDAAFYQNPPDTAAMAADILKRGIVSKEAVYWPPRPEEQYTGEDEDNG
ncbi:MULTISPECIES: sel1 repeat family protein [unclassified Neisseria]|uniref:sel1 repeat family protein n=1 Tax=unclassified Neisseria TaxID=2623750 RepID=UPI002666230C|nr:MULTISPECIES: sel1 repeat family protein [unclassified Neisseria]MDO1510109.1 sel1 repeat family protein [Neisseria sp. MVDL19-042950]MDO1516685.1 sel1 repeat family protein [Neisseria sp. MVDL18-041461]MDO1563832.1 sel1 repeat family protein [Neisseria sp. MVDL20-010259]